MTRVWLALGSNLGDRELHLRAAMERLRAPEFRITRVSPIYETAPQGYAEQGWFLNLVLEAETALTALDLLAHCESVEQALKRQRVISNGPRTIDVDILFYGACVIDQPRLQVPHPRYSKRRFVLQPLSDLEPNLQDPATGRTVGEMLAGVGDQPIRKFGTSTG